MPLKITVFINTGDDTSSGKTAVGVRPEVIGELTEIEKFLGEAAMYAFTSYMEIVRNAWEQTGVDCDGPIEQEGDEISEELFEQVVMAMAEGVKH